MPETQPRPHWIRRVDIRGIWGVRSHNIAFKQDVNILIGPNGSGKTTVLNLLQYALTANYRGLSSIDFQSIAITLQAFGSKNVRRLSVQPRDDGFTYLIGEEEYVLQREVRILGRLFEAPAKLPGRESTRKLRELLKGLVPSVWLSVSRRLPIPEGEEVGEAQSSQRDENLESVDHRVRYLVSELAKYRIRLDAQLAKHYKEFEKSVLLEMLYSKDQDQLSRVRVQAISEDAKGRLIRALQTVELYDERVEKRVDEHFATAREALERISDTRKREDLTASDFFVLPLIRRTNAIVEHARQMEQQRDEIFQPLRRFEDSINSFLQRKELWLAPDGSVHITSTKKPLVWYEPDQLSSGEKQLLILLVEALLREEQPVIYVADEPELSLHVTWQSQLLKALTDVGGRMQVIVATHSPDIVGPFLDRVIELAPADE